MVINGFSYKKQASISEHNQSRTEFFFDAVIAIAITMFALEIDVPGGDIFDWQSLKILFGEITTYFISFIVLPVYGYYTHKSTAGGSLLVICRISY